MKRLSTGKIFALCMGDFAKGLINGIITTYLLTFFIPTSSKTTLPQFFLNAALIMAAIRGVGTIVDAITDPWVAGLTDRCKSKLGRRIPFLRWSAVPYGLCCLMIFFPPVNGTSYVNAVWVGVLLILYYLFSTLYNIPFNALQAEIVTEPERRVLLYTVNSLLYVISTALVFCTSMTKGILMGAGISEIWALRIPFIVCCVGGIVAALTPAFAIREQDYTQQDEHATGNPLLAYGTQVVRMLIRGDGVPHALGVSGPAFVPPGAETGVVQNLRRAAHSRLATCRERVAGLAHHHHRLAFHSLGLNERAAGHAQRPGFRCGGRGLHTQCGKGLVAENHFILLSIACMPIVKEIQSKTEQSRHHNTKSHKGIGCRLTNYTDFLAHVPIF